MDKLKRFFFNIANKIRNVNKGFYIRLFIVIMLLIKSIIFMTLIEDAGASTFSFDNLSFKFVIVYFAFIMVIISFGYLFKSKNHMRYLIIVDILYSLLLIFDLWYFRGNYDFLGLKNIFFKETFNPMNKPIIHFSIIDLIFLIDLPIIFIWKNYKKTNITENRSIKKFIMVFSGGLSIILISFILIDVVGVAGWDKKLFKQGWTPLMTIRASGPMGYHSYEGIKTLAKVANKIDDKDKKDINHWLNYNKENLEDNKYKGMFKGKNVIFLQLESFENFVINNSANGKELTPFLNKLAREGFYFDNIYEQNNAGNSIDCDLMVNTSIFPLGDKITALNYGEDIYSNSLSRVLNSEGYSTISTHAEKPAEFNWTELHKNGFGSKELWSIDDYVYEETVGYGLSDRSFLSQIADKLKNVKKPFSITIPTLSSHGPFNIDKKYRELNLPPEIDESYLGGYFESVHYTDKQVEMFLNKLDENGMLDNTVLVIYGDHGGVHKYYDEDIKDLNFEGDWWKEYTKEIPLIIYSKDMEGKTFNAHGGQVDILPTVAYLLGIDNDKYLNTSMGRVLVNTNRDATIIKGNEIKGNISSQEEKEHLLNAYRIGDLIIKNNYFSQIKK